MNLSVPDAVWLATALLSYEKLKTDTVESLNDVALKQAANKSKRRFLYYNVASILNWGAYMLTVTT